MNRALREPQNRPRTPGELAVELGGDVGDESVAEIGVESRRPGVADRATGLRLFGPAWEALLRFWVDRHRDPTFDEPVEPCHLDLKVSLVHHRHVPMIHKLRRKRQAPTQASAWPLRPRDDALGLRTDWPGFTGRGDGISPDTDPADANREHYREMCSTMPTINSTADLLDKPCAPQSDCQVVKAVACATAARTALRRLG